MFVLIKFKKRFAHYADSLTFCTVTVTEIETTTRSKLSFVGRPTNNRQLTFASSTGVGRGAFGGRGGELELLSILPAKMNRYSHVRF